LLAAIWLAGCNRANPPPPADASTAPSDLFLSSPAFSDGAAMPSQFTGDGQNISPPLAWANAPAQTREFAIICEDPDADGHQPWVHWVIYKIPASVTALPEGLPKSEKIASPPGVLQGDNSWNRPGYDGPQPPHGSGVHHYHFEIFALDEPLDLDSGLSKDGLMRTMSRHILMRGELVGTYQR
jgi:Raf kinase inhibitor-like YbhB/YbcL family protein